jgi:hypothetical protein
MADGPIQRLWDSMQEYAWNQGRVIKQAPASFALAVLLACIPIGFVMWRGIDALYNERIAVLQATIQQLNALKAEVIPSARTRDPDGVFQLGQQVGRVDLPEIDESKSIAQFHRITGAANFNTSREFEYRNYVLRIRTIAGETTGDLAGLRTRALVGVECDIVDRR